MINIKYKDTTCSIKTTVDEITIKEFQEIINLEGLKGYRYYLEVYKILGLTEEFISVIDFGTLTSLHKGFLEDFDASVDENFIKEIKVNNKTYKSFEGDEFELSVRKALMLEDSISENRKRFLIDLVRIVFNIPKSEEKYIEALPVKIALPFLYLYTKTFLKDLNINEFNLG